MSGEASSASSSSTPLDPSTGGGNLRQPIDSRAILSPAPLNANYPSTSGVPSRKRGRAATNPNRTLVKPNDLEVLRETLGIPNTYIFRLPTPDQTYDNPPAGYVTFFLPQLKAGLTFPAPTFLGKVATYYGVPLNYFHPTAIKFMVCYWVVNRCLGLVPSASVFSEFFWLKTQKKEGTFTLTQRKDRLLFIGAASKIKNWRRLFFFVKPPFPFRWPRMGSAPKTVQSSVENNGIVERILSTVGSKFYDVEAILADHNLLTSAGIPRISPFEPVALTGRAKSLLLHLVFR